MLNPLSFRNGVVAVSRFATGIPAGEARKMMVVPPTGPPRSNVLPKVTTLQRHMAFAPLLIEIHVNLAALALSGRCPLPHRRRPTVGKARIMRNRTVRFAHVSFHFGALIA